MYTKNEAVSQVLLAVSGGVLSEDIPVLRVDIEPYLAAAVNSVIGQELMIQREQMRLDRRFGTNLYGTWDASSDMISTFREQTEWNATRQLYQIEMPYRLQDLPGNLGLNEIHPDQGTVRFNKIESLSDLNHIEGIVSEEVLYWIERPLVTGKTLIMFYNMADSCTVNIRLIADIRDIPGDTPLPIPQRLEKTIIDQCVEFFRAQRFGFADKKSDQVDEAGKAGLSNSRPSGT